MWNHSLNFLLLALAMFELANYSECSNNEELAKSIQSVITYFNNSVNLMERMEMVEKFYEMEKADGVFLPVQMRLSPARMQRISNDIEALEFEARHKMIGDETILLKIRSLAEELEDSYGGRDQNFTIRRREPLVRYIKTVAQMKKNWEGIVQEFREYTQSQSNTMQSYHIIKEFGIPLAPADDASVVILVGDERVENFLQSHPKDEFFDENATFEDVKARVKDQIRKAPKQTNQEIKALQKVLMGEEIDPIAKQMLVGFLPEVNRMCTIIIQKIFELEYRVIQVEEEHDRYGVYIMDTRDELFDKLQQMREHFDLRIKRMRKEEL